MFDEIDLTEDEKAILDKLSLKIDSQIDDFKKKNIEKLAKECEDPNLFQPKEPERVTNYPREILIKINAEMSTSTDSNKLLKVDNVVENYYHIPVPSGIDYTEKIDTFMEKFDEQLEDFVIKIKTDGSK